MTPFLLVALPAFGVVSLWALTDLQGFVLLGVLSSMIIPAAIVQSAGLHIAVADVLLLVALVCWLMLSSADRVRRPRVRGNKVLLAAMAFVMVTGESLAWSTAPAATAKFTLQLLELIVVFPLVFAMLPRSVNAIRRGFMVFVGVSCALAVASVLEYAPHAAAGDLSGGSLPLGLQKNTTGSFLAAGLVLAYALWASESRRSGKIAFGLAALIEALGLAATVSRGAIIGAAVAILLVSLLLRRRRVVTVALVMVAAIIYLGTIGTTSHNQNRIKGSYDSSTLRAYAWRDAVRKIEQRPWLGTGGATYSDDVQQLGAIITDPNNLVLLTWAELGIPGILGFALLIAAFVRLLSRCRRLPGECGTLAVAAGGVTISWFVHSQFDIAWTRGTASLAFAMIGLMLALERLTDPAFRTQSTIALGPGRENSSSLGAAAEAA